MPAVRNKTARSVASDGERACAQRNRRRSGQPISSKHARRDGHVLDNVGQTASLGTKAVRRTRAAGPSATNAASPIAVVAGGRAQHLRGWLEDAGLLLLVVIAFPLMILIVGTPIALLLRLLTEIGRRW